MILRWTRENKRIRKIIGGNNKLYTVLYVHCTESILYITLYFVQNRDKVT